MKKTTKPKATDPMLERAGELATELRSLDAALCVVRPGYDESPRHKKIQKLLKREGKKRGKSK